MVDNAVDPNEGWPLGNPDQAAGARLNITWANQNGDLPDPVAYDTEDAVLLAMAKEAVQTDGVPGIQPDPNVDFTDFVVDRFPPDKEINYPRMFIRPKAAYGEC